MTELFEPSDAADRRLALSAAGALAQANQAGVLTAADVHVATRLAALAGETDEAAWLALAAAVRGVRHGSVCVDLGRVAQVAMELTWPGADWSQRVADSALARAGVLHVERDLVYLDRYWREERLITQVLRDRASQAPPPIDQDRLARAAGLAFGAGYDEQRAAALTAASRWTTVVTGGPGTGKTTAVAGMLALLADQSQWPLRVALTAPTGKAAARLQEAVAAATAGMPEALRARVPAATAHTMHRLLGSRPDTRTRFRHHRGNRLPHDVIVLDETSMVSLSMMARLLEAVRPDTRLILVGDADQLSSVEAGAVLSDLVAGLESADPGAVVRLATSHRFGPAIGTLAAAIRAGDGDAVLGLLRAGDPAVDFVDPGAPETSAGLREVTLAQAGRLLTAAEAGDAVTALAALDDHRLLCAHRDGPFGANHWNRQVERWLSDTLPRPVGGGWGREWYPGRPVLITANDYGLKLFNGDTGVVVRDAGEAPEGGDGGLRVAISGRAESFAPSRLSDVDTMHALTIHKSQGGQAREVTVLLPEADSPLATRELFYTAVTRAQDRVRVVATEEMVRAAVTRPAQRASGLRDRLAGEEIGR